MVHSRAAGLWAGLKTFLTAVVINGSVGHHCHHQSHYCMKRITWMTSTLLGLMMTMMGSTGHHRSSDICAWDLRISGYRPSIHWCFGILRTHRKIHSPESSLEARESWHSKHFQATKPKHSKHQWLPRFGDDPCIICIIQARQPGVIETVVL